MKLFPTKNAFLLSFLLLLLVQTGYAQFNIPGKPNFQTSLYDYANILSSTDKTNLEEKLIRYSDSTSTQIVVVTVPTVSGEDIGLLAPKWAHAWGVGQKNEDNGVFVLLALKEKKIYIAPGYGVEERLTAGINGEIIRNIILPEFKAGNYYKGLDKGSDAIFDVLKGKYKGSRKGSKGGESNSGGLVVFIIIFIVILFILSKNKNNRNGGNRGGGLDLSDIIILSSLGRGGGGFGGSSGGGFGGGGGGFGGGFGGGGFSGGGAGGSW